MSIHRALVIGATSGVGQATAAVLTALGARVVAAGSERDATDPAQVEALLDEVDPDLVVVAAGAHPRMASLEEQSWELFSEAWNVDVRTSFQVGCAVLARPLRPGSTVLMVSSGAALHGSPLSGGYAGAKRMQMFLARYLQRASDGRGLGIRFVALAPNQLLAGTPIGEAAAAAYGGAVGVSADDFLKRDPAPLDAAGVARAIVSIALGEEHPHATLPALTGNGLEAI